MGCQLTKEWISSPTVSYEGLPNELSHDMAHVLACTYMHIHLCGPSQLGSHSGAIRYHYKSHRVFAFAHLEKIASATKTCRPV